MTADADVDARVVRSTASSEPIPVPAAKHRWKRLRSTAIVLATQVAILAAFLGFWDHMTSRNSAAAFMFGSPSAIAGFLVQMARDGSLWRDTYVTGLETLLGFFVGNLVGTVVGLSLWYSRFVSRVVEPFVIAIGSIPIIALAPIIIIWFGTGLISKVAMSTLSVVIVALVTSYKGAVGVDADQINLMRTLGASKFQIFRKLVVPASLTDIFAGLKLTVGFALIGAIVGEFMSSSEGLGHAIFKAGSLYIIPKVFAALVATIALALILTFIVGKIERLLMPWRRL
jgi:NitT/TauT family transport system permease protein